MLISQTITEQFSFRQAAKMLLCLQGSQTLLNAFTDIASSAIGCITIGLSSAEIAATAIAMKLITT